MHSCDAIVITSVGLHISWWHHQTEAFPAQRPVTRSFDVFFDLRLNKRLSKQSWGWWFKTLSRPLWRHCNVSEVISQWMLWNHDSSGRYIGNLSIHVSKRYGISFLPKNQKLRNVFFSHVISHNKCMAHAHTVYICVYIGCALVCCHYKTFPMVHFGYGLSQWKTTLHCNVVSHRLSPYPVWSLFSCEFMINIYIYSSGLLHWHWCHCMLPHCRWSDLEGKG